MEMKKVEPLEKILVLNHNIKTYEMIDTQPNGYRAALGESVYESLRYLHKKIADEFRKDKERYLSSL